MNIAGHTWNLWKGPNANWQVFSFVSATGDITNFNADLNAFFSKRHSSSRRATAIDSLLDSVPHVFAGCRHHSGMFVHMRHARKPSDIVRSKFIQAIQTGTEPFVGSADLFTKSFSVAVNV